MARRKKVYEGKAKILYEGPEPGTLIQYFKDDATAFNAQKKAVLEGKTPPPAAVKAFNNLSIDEQVALLDKLDQEAAAIKAADAKVRETVERILEQVEAGRDAAVRELSQAFALAVPPSPACPGTET